MPGPLSALDWSILVGYVVFATWVGVRLSKRASQNVDEFFLSGRSLPWWIAGTSMVATTFAADTPLLITGWVRDEGIWKNWVWWCLAINVSLQVFLFSRWWRRAGVMTKGELVELRYRGRGASALRATLGLLHSAVLNTLTICWVMLAAGKIAEVLFEVDRWVGMGIACVIAMGYSLLAGFWGVVLTDLVQFAMAMVGAIALAWISWTAVGGIDAVQAAIDAGTIASERVAILPGAGEASAAFVVYLSVQWWAFEGVDGSGVGVQRISASRDERHGLLGLLWYSVAHNALRPWCWILVGLASLLVLPHLEVSAPVFAGEATVVEVTDEHVVLEDATQRHTISLAHERATEDWHPRATVAVDAKLTSGAVVAATDSELAYVVMMVRYLPAGLLGLVAASLLAAFMSTIDTHVNLAASYFVNDLYRRFFRPDAGERHYVQVARVASVVVLLLGTALATKATSVRDLFMFFLAFGAGAGPVYVMRWLWWRVRASTEITAMLTSALVSTSLTLKWIDPTWSLGALSPGGELSDPGRLVVVAGVSLVAALASMLVTRAPDPATLVPFYRRTRPIGWWGPVKELAGVDDATARAEVGPALLGTLGAVSLVYGTMLALGFLFLDRGGALAIATAVATVGTVAVLVAIRRITRDLPA